MNNGTIEIAAAIFVLFVAMFDPRISAAVAIALLGILAYYKWKNPRGDDDEAAARNVAQVEERKRNIELVLGLAKEQGEIANDDVEELLGVSDATAERYLQELEAGGHLVQTGEAGRGVVYTLR